MGVVVARVGVTWWLGFGSHGGSGWGLVVAGDWVAWWLGVQGDGVSWWLGGSVLGRRRSWVWGSVFWVMGLGGWGWLVAVVVGEEEDENGGGSNVFCFSGFGAMGWVVDVDCGC